MQLAASFAYGKLVHEGLTLAIVGRPNVGKSSLFNSLVESDRAIVTATPGTTRDLVTETVALGGIPVKLVDTAGIRHALDEAESIGIRKSMEALADADLVLVVLDSSEPVGAEDERLLALVAPRTAILVENKSDKTSLQFQLPSSQLRRVRVSALTGAGIPELRAEILRHAGGEFDGSERNWFPHQHAPSGAGARLTGGAGCSAQSRCAIGSRTRWSCLISTAPCVRSMKLPGPPPTMTS